MFNFQKQNSNEMIYETFRNLYKNHVLWTGSYIAALALNFGNLSYYNQRMNDNIKEFFNEFLKYYGYNYARVFSTLLENHILTNIKYMVDYKAGDMQAVETDRKAWYDNADDMAAFLSQINPYWDKQVWQNLLYEHIRLTEIELIYENTYKKKSEEQSKITENHALLMADYMAEGIIKQFYK